MRVDDPTAESHSEEMETLAQNVTGPFRKRSQTQRICTDWFRLFPLQNPVVQVRVLVIAGLSVGGYPKRGVGPGPMHLRAVPPPDLGAGYAASSASTNSLT